MTLASETFCSISAAVLFVVSRFSTNLVSPSRLPPADESRERRSSSSELSMILKSFCCFVNSAWNYRKFLCLGLHVGFIRILNEKGRDSRS